MKTMSRESMDKVVSDHFMYEATDDIDEEVVPVQAHYGLNALTLEVREQALIEATKSGFPPQRAIRSTDHLMLRVVRKGSQHALER